MPLFELACKNSECTSYAKRVERLLRRFDDPNPECETCGGETARLISRPRLVWLRDLVSYDSPKAETFRKDQARGFHTVARKRSRGGTDEKPVYQRIRTRKEQVEYCREEGLVDPSEAPHTMDINSDGDKCSGAGLPGAWT